METAEDMENGKTGRENTDIPIGEDVEVEFPDLGDTVKDVEWDPNRFEPEDLKGGAEKVDDKDLKNAGGKPISERGAETFHEDLERLKGENHAAYTVLLVLFLVVLFPLVFLVAIPFHALVQGLAEAFRTAKDDYSTAIDLLAHGRDDGESGED